MNGTTNARGDLLLESGLLLEWNVGEKYTITIIKTGGNAVLGTGEGITYSFSFFSNNNAVYLRSGNLYVEDFPEKITFSGNAIAEAGGSGYKFYLQLWRVGTVFNNYKFKVQIEKGTESTQYEQYNPNTPRKARILKIGDDNNVVVRAKKAYVSDNGVAKLFFEEVPKESAN